jgi:hypothetical protein
MRQCVCSVQAERSDPLKCPFLAAVFVLTPVMVLAGDVRIGPTFGVSFIEHKDTSLTHGPLHDEVTVGPTVLAGVTVDFRLTPHDHVDAEFAIGPYHNDVERSCVSSITPCTPTPFKSASHAMLYGMQYVRTFGARSWLPYLTAGVGVKSYAYQEEFEPENASATLTFGVGAEMNRRSPLRVEFRTMIVRDNPLLLGKTQVELQARVTWLLHAGK